MLVIIAIAVLLVLAAVMIVATGRRRATTGSLSRETRRRDRGGQPGDAPNAGAVSEAESTEARARADDTRAALGSGGAPPAPRGETAPATRVEVDEETVGIARRQFFNRALLLVLGLVAVPAFGASLIAFLWPTAGGGFGSKVKVGTSRSDIETFITSKKQPFYVPEARAYIQPYPSGDIKAAEAVYQAPIVANMNEGLTAIYQKCPHLGCKVPWCPSSQWFECPCHGSKYNRVGEKKGGPAPRGMDRFAMAISANSIEINTEVVFLGPPIGTDTTGQGQEGPPCVGA
ncbi:MAG TPA: Rieske 2Fe-2S domain-containing protein [Acidimicrobiia bacterium]|nr:Rieske 2Fe-2S domain-containing protein [Acidimicrobiia bacterium]